MKDKKYNLYITKMTKEHIPQIAAIEAEVFSVPWSEQAFADALGMEQAVFYTALADGCVAGYCGIYFAADEGEITNVAAAPAYRRHKIAETLLKKALSEAQERSVRHIYLEVRRSNIPAVRLYEKIGFRTAGMRKDFYRYPVEDALVMLYENADK